MFDLAYTLESYDLVPATEGIKDVAKKVWGKIIEKNKKGNCENSCVHSKS